MNRTIFLSCLVVIIGSLVWTARAQEDFETEKQRVIETFKNADVASLRESNVLSLVDFYKKFGWLLKPRHQILYEDLVAKINEEKAKQPEVEGAPPQGGWATDLLKGIAIQLGTSLLEVLTKSKQS